MIKSALKDLVYSVMDIITLKRGIPRKINNSTVRFQPKWSRFFKNNYESENYTFLYNQIKPGMHIIDIGAHIGLFGVVASQLTGKNGKVVCVEPTPGTISVLKKTLKLNHCENVILQEAAVSDKEGNAIFFMAPGKGNNANSLVNNNSVHRVEYKVQLITIDSIVANNQLRPSVIKIDAEGAELDVLKGGKRTFDSFKPALILGLHPAFVKNKGDSLAAIWDLLMEHNYVIKSGNNLIDKSFFCSGIDVFDVNCT